MQPVLPHQRPPRRSGILCEQREATSATCLHFRASFPTTRADRPRRCRGPRTCDGPLGHALAGVRAQGPRQRSGRNKYPQRLVATLAAMARRRERRPGQKLTYPVPIAERLGAVQSIALTAAPVRLPTWQRCISCGQAGSSPAGAPSALGGRAGPSFSPRTLRKASEGQTLAAARSEPAGPGPKTRLFVRDPRPSEDLSSLPCAHKSRRPPGERTKNGPQAGHRMSGTNHDNRPQTGRKTSATSTTLTETPSFGTRGSEVRILSLRPFVSGTDWLFKGLPGEGPGGLRAS